MSHRERAVTGVCRQQERACTVGMNRREDRTERERGKKSLNSGTECRRQRGMIAHRRKKE